MADADPTISQPATDPFYAAASAMGVRVIVTGLIGLGTPGQHTYVNHTEEGHAALDAARAGLAFADAPADSPIAFYEYSRGGGAAAGAAEHAASYAPELASLQDRYFNDKGHECIGDPVESWENTDTRTLTKDGRSFSEIAEQDARLRDVLTGPHYSLVCGRLTLPCLSSTPPMTTPSRTTWRSSSRRTTAPSAERWSSPQTPFRK